jgi:uncharacterized damage-inducible protein DinB
LQGTLVHTLFAEWVWRNRWQGMSPTQRFDPAEFPTLSVLHERWTMEEKALMGFLQGLDDGTLNAPFDYSTTHGTPMHEPRLWPVMVHLVNHGTQHRSEAAAILTGYGFSPGDMDLITFLREPHP